MTKVEQRTFIVELVKVVTGEILLLHQKDKIPENWDGIELRWLLREKFQAVVRGFTDERLIQRYKEYANTVLVENL